MVKEKSTFKLKDQLAGIAALIAAIVAIGGGFAKYGELKQKITALELASKKVDTQIVAVLEEKVSACPYGVGTTIMECMNNLLEGMNNKDEKYKR